MNRIKGALTRKLGPLPAWVWLGLFTIAVIVYRARASNVINPVNVSDTTPTETGTTSKGDPVTLQPGESVYDPNTGAVSGGAPEQITPPDPIAPPDPLPPITLDPGQGAYDPNTGQLITNPGVTNTGEDSGTDPGTDNGSGSGSSLAASGRTAQTTKITKRRGSGDKREWRYNGHWHTVPPKDAVNERRSVKTKTGKKEVEYWWGNHWHTKPMPKSKSTQMMTGTAKPTTRTGGGPRAARVNPGRPVGAPTAVMSRPRSNAAMAQTLSKAGGVGTGTPPGRARDNQAPGQSRARSLPATIPTATVMRARPVPSPTVTPTIPHTSATPPPPVPPMRITPIVAKVVSKPQPKGTTTKIRPR